ncbi:YgfZ/GcvT domain-containing protein [Arenicella xantha]|nr:folate-binding protein YgfZ [Arenicella xantha]
MKHQLILPHLNLVRVSGTDAATFLQGQLTNDVQKLDTNWQWSGYCNPKGRLLANMIMWRSDDSFYMLLEKSLAEPTVKRLQMYVMRSKVTIELINTATCIGDLKPSQPHKPYQSLECQNSDNHTVWFDQRCIHIQQSAVDDAELDTTIALSAWLLRDIESGLPWVNSDTVEQFIPQMINYDAIDGISFKKGCYTGQEIVARMHYLGKLKQRMFLCDLSTSLESIKPGDKIVSNTDGRVVGTLVNVLTDQTPCLAVLRLDVVDEISFKVVAETEPTNASIEIRAKQPYAFPEPKKT